MSITEPKQGDTYRTRCGRGRITYDPEFYRTRPWVTVVGGTVCNSYGSFADAEHHLTQYHELKPVERGAPQ